MDLSLANMKNLWLFLLLLFSPPALAKPVKYAELSNAGQAVEYNCTVTHCYVRVFYYFMDKNYPMVYCLRLLNQPIYPTGGWVGIANQLPQSNMTGEPLSREEMDWCKQ